MKNWLTIGLKVSEAHNICSMPSENIRHKHVISIPIHIMENMDVVNISLLFFLLNSAFVMEQIKLPPKPIIQYSRLSSVETGSITCITDRFITPIKRQTSMESINMLIFPAIEVNNVGIKNSLNLLFIN